MFLMSLTLTKSSGEVIRKIEFRNGLNLIVDETTDRGGTETGNNVGKTTVLKLIDFCLGADPKEIYSDPEHRKLDYRVVKDFLVENEVSVMLVLKEDLDVEESREVAIERWFSPKKVKSQQVDGVELTQDGFDEALTEILFPGHYGKKPTFRQIISHNIRYSEQSLTHTIKHLHRFTRDDEYEVLYLFLLGCPFDQGDLKQNLRSQIDLEEKFRKRLEYNQTKAGYEATLAALSDDIIELDRQKSSLNLNPHFEESLDRLNVTKYQINRVSSELGRLELRRSLVIEALEDLQSEVAKVDMGQLRLIYEQATSLVSGIQKTFEDMCKFHNEMVEARRRFISTELPSVEATISEKEQELELLLQEEGRLASDVAKSDTFDTLEKLVSGLNEKFRQKGECENALNQLVAVESKLSDLSDRMKKVDSELFSEKFEQIVKEQQRKFNRHFSTVSQELYGETYLLKADKIQKKKGTVYEFTAFNANTSSGKKQGEISCFDIAYTLFADEEGIPCMHFLLTDKKELVHNNQLVKIANLVNAKKVQFIASMLRDKLPKALDKEENIVLRLSQADKLFRIEQLGH